MTIGLCSALFALNALADPAGPMTDGGVTLAVSSEGISTGGGVWLGDRLAVRLEASLLSFPATSEQDLGTFTGRTDWRSVRSSIALFPPARDHWSDGLFLSGGLQLQDHRLRGEQRLGSDPVLVGGIPVDGAMAEALRYEAIAPRLGTRVTLGYDSGLAKPTDSALQFTAEVGLLYRGDAQVRYSAVQPQPAVATPLAQALDAAALTGNRPALMAPVWPVISIGGRWRF